MTIPIQIRRDDVVQDIRDLAALTNQPITDAVAEAVRIALARARGIDTLADRRRAVEEAVRMFQEAPVVGPMLTDADLYDEDGQPK
jgi:hypothetical protein